MSEANVQFFNPSNLHYFTSPTNTLFYRLFTHCLTVILPTVTDYKSRWSFSLSQPGSRSGWRPPVYPPCLARTLLTEWFPGSLDVWLMPCNLPPSWQGLWHLYLCLDFKKKYKLKIDHVLLFHKHSCDCGVEVF